MTLDLTVVQASIGVGLVIGLAVALPIVQLYASRSARRYYDRLLEHAEEWRAATRIADAIQSTEADPVEAARADLAESRRDLEASERDLADAYLEARRQLAEGLEIVVMSQVPLRGGASRQCITEAIGSMVVDDVVDHLVRLEHLRRSGSGRSTWLHHRATNVVRLPLRPRSIPDTPEGA